MRPSFATPTLTGVLHKSSCSLDEVYVSLSLPTSLASLFFGALSCDKRPSFITAGSRPKKMPWAFGVMSAFLDLCKYAFREKRSILGPRPA